MFAPEKTPVPYRDEISEFLGEFWPRFGEQIPLQKSTVSLILRDAREYYTGLPYHNFGHALGTLWRCMEFADICEAHGAVVDRAALTDAAAKHDAGMHHSPDTRSVDRHENPVSDEVHATHLMKLLWPKYNLTASSQSIAEHAVLATAADGPPPKVIEDKILIRADIDNIGGNFDQSFMRSSLLLREEAKIIAELGGRQPPSDIQFFLGSVVTIAKYLQKDLAFGDFDTDWSAHALLNLRRLAHTVVKSETHATSQLVQSLGKGVVQQLLKISPLTQE